MLKFEPNYVNVKFTECHNAIICVFKISCFITKLKKIASTKTDFSTNMDILVINYKILVVYKYNRVISLYQTYYAFTCTCLYHLNEFVVCVYRIFMYSTFHITCTLSHTCNVHSYSLSR